MSKLQAFRDQNPAYKDVPDEVLAPALHKKFYSSVPLDEFNAKLGIAAEKPGLIGQAWDAVKAIPGNMQDATNAADPALLGQPDQPQSAREISQAGADYIATEREQMRSRGASLSALEEGRGPITVAAREEQLARELQPPIPQHGASHPFLPPTDEGLEWARKQSGYDEKKLDLPEVPEVSDGFMSWWNIGRRTTRDLVKKPWKAIGDARRDLQAGAAEFDQTLAASGDPSRKLDQPVVPITSQEQLISEGVDSKIAGLMAHYVNDGIHPDAARNMAKYGEGTSPGSIKASPKDRSHTELALDTLLSAGKAVPMTAKFLVDMKRLTGADLVPVVGDVLALTSEWLGDSIDHVGTQQSPHLREKQKLMEHTLKQGNNKGLVKMLSANPDLLLDVALPSIGSMVIATSQGIKGGNAALEKATKRIAAKYGERGASAAGTRLALQAARKGATRSTITGVATLTASQAFSEAQELGLDVQEQYAAAGISYLASLAGGALTGGGASGMLARSVFSQPRSAPGLIDKVAHAFVQVGAGGLREGSQEIFDEGGEALGVQVAQVMNGQRDHVNFAEIQGKMTIGFMAGAALGAMGGGVSVAMTRSQADEILDELARHVEMGVFDPAGLDAIARALMDPGNAQLRVVEDAPQAEAAVDPIADAQTIAPGSADPIVSDPSVVNDSALDDMLMAREAAAQETGDPVEVALTQLENETIRTEATPAPDVSPETTLTPEAEVTPSAPAPAVQSRPDGTLEVQAAPDLVKDILTSLGLSPQSLAMSAGGTTVVGRTQAETVQAAIALAYPDTELTRQDLTNVHLAAQSELGTKYDPRNDIRLVSPSTLWGRDPSGTGGTRVDGPAAAFMGAVARAANFRFVLFESPSGRVSTGGFILDTDNTTVYLNARGNVNPLTEAVHEVTHLFKQRDPAAYAAYELALTTVTQGQPILDTSEAALLDWLNTSYLADSIKKGAAPYTSMADVQARAKLTPARVLEEFIGDATGVASESARFWPRVFKELARTDQSALKKLITLFREMSASVKATLGMGGSFPAVRKYINDMDALVDEAARFVATAGRGQRLPQSPDNAGTVIQSPARIGPFASRKTADTTAQYNTARGTPSQVVTGQDGKLYVENGEAVAPVTGTQRTGDAQPVRNVDASTAQDVVPSYGQARDGAISVTGTHYSGEQRSALSGAFYGTGLKGAESTRLEGADPELQHRVYFYADAGKGVAPESGVGSNAHSVTLNNIYDAAPDALNLKARDLNTFEMNVINAGFDGYLNRGFQGSQGAVVLLGTKHSAVPVAFVGTGEREAAGQKLPDPVKTQASQDIERLLTLDGVPGGQVSPERWGNIILGIDPELHATMDARGLFEGTDPVYRSELAGQMRRPAVKASPDRVAPAALAGAKKDQTLKITASASFKPGKKYGTVRHPATGGDLTRLHNRMLAVTRGAEFNALLQDIGLQTVGSKQITIRGMWMAEPEWTQILRFTQLDGSPATFEQTRLVANLLAWGAQQDAALTSMAVADAVAGEYNIPSLYFGKEDGKAMSATEADAALAEFAKVVGGASVTSDGKAVKMLFFPDDDSALSEDDQFTAFSTGLAQAAQAGGLDPSPFTQYTVSSMDDFEGENGQSNYRENLQELWTEALAGLDAGDLQAGSGGRAVSAVLVPYIAAVRAEGFTFDFDRWAERNGASARAVAELTHLVEAVENEARHGLKPRLREKVDISGMPTVPINTQLVQKTTGGNAAKQLAVLDGLKRQFPGAASSPKKWLEMSAHAFGSNDVPVAPRNIINLMRNKGAGILDQLRQLTPGQISDATAGFSNAAEFLGHYTSGRVPVETTGKMMLWSFLSRGVSPYIQEAMFIDAVRGVEPFVRMTAAGEFGPAELTQFKDWADGVAAANGAGAPGNATKHNLNAFGEDFLTGMSARMKNGKTKLQYLHDLMSDAKKSGRDIRREFVKIGTGVGIDNKVISFTLLVTGRTDVLVLDRVQMRNLFDDGRFAGYNLYDGTRVTKLVTDHAQKDKRAIHETLAQRPGEDDAMFDERVDTAKDALAKKLDVRPGAIKAERALEPGTGLANMTTGVRGLMLYETMEDKLQKVLPGVYEQLGRPQDGTAGRYHWESWVVVSGQEASHGTLDSLLYEVEGRDNVFADVTAQQGEYGQKDYGVGYARDTAGKPYYLYPSSTGVEFKLSHDNWRTVLKGIDKIKGRIKGFLMSQNEDGSARTSPWYNDTRFDRAGLDALLAEHGTSTGQVKLSPQRGENLARAFVSVSQMEDVFQAPISKAKDLAGIVADVIPGASFADVTKGYAKDKNSQVYRISKGGSDAFVTHHTGLGMAWINVQGQGIGKGGSRIYAAVGNYAANNGLAFIGDPDGISPMGKRRRLENLVSLGVKFPGLDVRLHKDQRAWLEDEFGVTVDVREGDSLHNLGELIHAAHRVNTTLHPELEHVQFTDDGRFVDRRTDRPFDFEGLASSARESGMAGSAASVGAPGVTTLRRAALAKSIVESTTPEGNSPVLESLYALRDQSAPTPDALKGILYSPNRGDLGFYSQLAAAVDGVPARLETQPAAQWKAWLAANAGKLGVKKDEIQWSGVTEWLDMQGKRKVTKDEISAYLEQGGVRVQEVTLGGDAKNLTLDQARDVLAAGGQIYAVERANENNVAGATLSDGRILPYIESNLTRYHLREGDPDAVISREEGTKYEGYRVPGGTNYREVLLTLPRASKDSFSVMAADVMGDYWVRNNDTGEEVFFGDKRGAEEAAVRLNAGPMIKKDVYRSSHWEGTPNVLAHIRLDDRTDADGNKVLFVQEVQSDWGQEGRKEGFQPRQVAGDAGRLTDLQTQSRELKAGRDAWELTPEEQSRWNGLESEIAQEQARLAGRETRGVPAAPFVTDTKAWSGLAIKRIITLAAEGGYDKVAFVSGEQAADVFGLDKKVSELLYNKGTQSLRATDMNGDDFINRKVTPAELPDVIGKEMADRILSSEGNFVQLSGDGLKVEAKGMRAFYDQIVPQVANDVLKKLGGGKVAPIAIPHKGREGKSMRAEDIVRQRNAGSLTDQLSFDITPAMRETVKTTGVPLFSPNRINVDGADRPTTNSTGKPIHPTEEGLRNFWRWFGDSKAVDAEGQPRVVYHGSNEQFSVFDMEYAQREDNWSFSSSKDVAQTYQLQELDADKVWDAYQNADTAKRRKLDKEFDSFIDDDGVTLDTVEAWVEEANGDDPQLWARDLASASGLPASTFFGASPYGQMVAAYLKLDNPIVRDFKRTADIQSETRPEGTPDGYIDHNVMDTNNPGAAWLYSDVFHVNSSEQIKSATINDGNFDGTNPDIRFSPRRGAPPEKTVTAYKLFRVDARQPGKLFPLFVDANTPVELGAWYDADVGELNNTGKVKSKIGPLAYRPGWHAGDLPLATHIGGKSQGSRQSAPDIRPENQVWAEVEMAADVDWQAEADRRGTNVKGKIVPVKAHITDQIPTDGYYRYKTNPNMAGSWLIGGSMAVTRVLSDAEVESINAAAGVADLPRAEPFAAEKYGFGIRRSPPRPGAGFATPAMPSTRSKKALDKIVYQFQDRFTDLKAIQKSIVDTGQTIRDEFNPYQVETLMHGKAAYRNLMFLETEVEPLLKLMKAAKVTTPEMDNYLHARHASERNAAMADINPGPAELDQKRQDAEFDLNNAQVALSADPTSYPLQQAAARAQARFLHFQNAKPWSGTAAERLMLSGMSDADAAAVLAAARPVMQQLAAKVDKIIEGTRTDMAGYGLEAINTLTDMASAYQYYVPLRRDMDESDLLGTMGGTGAGFSIRGSQLKRATGSLRDVESPLAHIVAQREQTIVRGEKNRVAKALYGLVMENPNEDLWAVIKPGMSKKALRRELAGMGLDPDTVETMVNAPTKPVINERTGLVEHRVSPMYSTMNNAVVLRIKGEDRVILFNKGDDRAMRLVRALRNEDTDFSNGASAAVMTHIGPITRYLSAINTQYNPVFGLTNFSRDIQGALLNLETTPIKSKKVALTKAVPGALRGIWNWERGDKSHPWAKIYEEFLADGGATGYRDQYATIEKRAKAIEKMLNGKPIRDAVGIKQTLDLLSDYNTTIENSIRLAAYKTARDAGMSRSAAADLAKDITVNFNRKGARSGFMASAYMFFNSAVQGTERTFRVLTNPKTGTIIVGGGIALGAMNAAIGMLMMGDDWDEIPEFEREKHLILPIGGGKYIKIPYQLGYNALPNIGRTIVEMAVYQDRLGERATNLIGATADAFNPLGASSFAGMVAPSVYDPIQEIRSNESSFGRPIERKDLSSLNPTPGHSRAREGTAEAFKLMSRGINAATGGDKYEAGMWSPTPEVLSYAFGVVSGGLGREFDKFMATGEALYTGDKLPAHRVPIASRFFGEASSDTVVRGKYFTAVREINVAERALKLRAADGADIEGHIALGALGRHSRKVQGRVSELQKLRQATTDRDQRKELENEIVALQTILVDLHEGAKSR